MNPLTEFDELAQKFDERFEGVHFPEQPEKLYHAAQYLLTVKGKRVRPVLCLMANELFVPITDDAFYAAQAIELFHNFTLVHDDIMDNAPLRRGQPTVHEKFGNSTAILAGDVMLVQAYEYLKKIDIGFLPQALTLFNNAARKVCEGQELDIEFESMREISLDQYIEMIGLKTSVLLAASLKMGALLGGAGTANQANLFEFGRNLGIAFQIQDDYLDAFGNPEKFGKKRGGDILANKKTFLLLQTINKVSGNQKIELERLLALNDESKIEPMINLYRECGVDSWAREMKEKYFNLALEFLDEVAVRSQRKEPLRHLAYQLLNREA